MANELKTKRNVDIVFCIDGTGSMTPCIESVKKNAQKFYQDFTQNMMENGSDIEGVRIKVIVFRDYLDDGDQAMVESPFYELPDDEDDYTAFLNGITAIGGGDNPENGLEALALAMKADFVVGAKDRQVIVLFTDDDAVPLGVRSSCPNYTADMPADLDELVNMWYSGIGQAPKYNLRESNKRLLIYAPEKVNTASGVVDTIYSQLPSKLNRLSYKNVNMADGLGEIDFSDVIKTIAASASAK